MDPALSGHAEADLTVDSAEGPPEVTLARVVAALDAHFAAGGCRKIAERRGGQRTAMGARAASRHGDRVLTGFERLRVDLGARGYDILVGRGLMAEAGSHLAPLLKQKRVIVVTDRNVARHHLKWLERSLHAAGIASTAVTLDPGEQTKSFAELADPDQPSVRLKVERNTTLVALGGRDRRSHRTAASICAASTSFRSRPRFWPRWTIGRRQDRDQRAAGGKNLVGVSISRAWCSPILRPWIRCRGANCWRAMPKW